MLTDRPNPTLVKIEDDKRISGRVTQEDDPISQCMAYVYQRNDAGHQEVVDVTLTDSDGEYQLSARTDGDAWVGVWPWYRYSHLRPPYGYYDTWIRAPERTQ